jgi:TolB-like protein/tetratricopeptide (TPR) repeat protein
VDQPFAAYRGDEPYVFVCYAHEDEGVVYPEIGWLHEQGINLWYDEGISAGRIWREEIGDAIKAASSVLYYISESSLASDHCSREINFALDQHKNVLPVYLEDVALTTDLEVGLSRVQALHRDNDVNYQQHLLHALGQSPAVEQSPVVSKKRRSWTSPAGLGLAFTVLLSIAAITWYLLPQEESPDALTEDALTPIRSIAVLPLENLSGDPEQQYFADGMHATLIGDLGKIRALQVISRRSVLRYRDTSKSLPEIARELNVDAIIEGTVIRAADRVRITAALIDARTDRQLWSERYEGELSDVLALHSDVARAVAEQVRIELTPEEQTALAASHIVDPQAYDAYLRGLQIVTSEPHTASQAWAPRVIEHLERAVALDPDFADAWVWLARVRGLLGLGADRRELAKAKDAALRAVDLDDQLGLAHTFLGLIRLYHDWDIAGARRALEYAVELSPGDPQVLQSYAGFLWDVDGRIDDALNMSARAMRLAPFDLNIRQERIFILHQARQYEKGLEEVEQARMLNPHLATQSAPALFQALGREKEARDAQVVFWDQCGTTCDEWRDPAERVWAMGGGHEEYIRLWLESLEKGHFEAVAPWLVASFYSEIGETDTAIDLLERGVRERDPLLIVVLRTFPPYDLLRFDPRFQELMRRVMGSSVLDEDPRVLAGVAQTLVRAGRAAEAIPHLEKAIELYPADRSFPRWLYYMSLAYFVEERYDEALEWAARALQHHGDVHNSAFAGFVRASSFAYLDRLEEARQSLNEAVRLWPGPLEIERDLRFIFTVREPALQDRYLDGLRQAGLEG